MSPLVHVLGVYVVDATPVLFAETFECKFSGLELDPSQRREAEGVVREELSRLVLIEVMVTGRDTKFEIRDFGQEGSDQAAYDEHYLNEDGTEVIARRFNVPAGTMLRVAFFLHYFDPAKALETSYGQVAIPQVSSMPERLSTLINYEPVE